VKALVTGAAGFVGRHMTLELIRRGYVVSRCDTAYGWDALDAFRIDITYDLVVHCAAAEPHRASIDGKPMLLAANLELDAAMFSWAVRTRTPVLYLSSSAAYPVHLQGVETDFDRINRAILGRPDRRLIEDDIRFGSPNVGTPDANYGWTKLTGERMALAAAETGLAVHIVRPFSGYGEDQAENFPFRAFVERAKRREDPFTIWGSADQVRDFIHISDVVAGALAVVDNDERRPVNLCTGVGTSMLDLAHLITEESGYEPEIKVDETAPLGVAYRVGDPNRMNQHHTARVTLEEGVCRALERKPPS
jgi:nucleoside-diphosphate-sugar epimerase